MKLSKWDVVKKAVKDELFYQKIVWSSRIKPVIKLVSRPWFTPLVYIYIYFRHFDNLLNILIFIFVCDLIIDLVVTYAGRKKEKEYPVLESNRNDPKSIY